MITLRDRYRGALVGLAVGDALGTTVEFKAPGTFEPMTTIVGGGPFNLPKGAWTDDTSMALCLGQSLIECRGMDYHDQMKKYTDWYEDGYMSSIGYCFDIGHTTRCALYAYKKRKEFYPEASENAGNGSIMRLAPVPMFYMGSRHKIVWDQSEVSSKTTHSLPICTDACRYLGYIIEMCLWGKEKGAILHSQIFLGSPPFLGSQAIREIAGGSFMTKNPPDIKGSGYVAQSLEAALWAFYKTDNFKDGALLAVNLGDDADTTGAVYGQIAGAFYGLEGIPPEWVQTIAKGEMIIEMADGLFDSNPFCTTGRIKT